LEESWSLFLKGIGFETIVVELRVDVDPLEGAEWREKFAVVESSGGTDWVVGWCSHHWGLDHGLGLGLVVGVRHVFPDPEGSGVEWAEIVTDDKLLAEFIVSIDGVFVGFGESPVESCLVNVTASVANFIGFVEIGLLSSFHLN